MATLDETLDALGDLWTELGVEARAKTWESSGVAEGRCVTCSGIVAAVLSRRGLIANVVTYNVVAGNAEAIEPMTSGRFDVATTPGAWTVGSHRDAPRTASSVAGHVVVDVGGNVLDFSAGQYDRPEHRVHIPGPLWFPPTESEMVAELDGGGFYWLQDRGKLSAWERSNCPALLPGPHETRDYFVGLLSRG